MQQNKRDSRYDAFIHPTTCAPDDFLGQVRRTLHGKPIPQEQVDIILFAIREALVFSPEDVLLDMCCGNGVIGKEFFDEIKGYHGVDFSPALVAIAQKNFQRSPAYEFTESDIETYLVNEPAPARFTKALQYGSLAYFTDKQITNILSCLFKRFTGVQRLFVAPLPDAAKADAFFQGKEKQPLDDPLTPIGRWFMRNEFKHLAESCGWSVAIQDMAPTSYQAHYRFDAQLTRKCSG